MAHFTLPRRPKRRRKRAILAFAILALLLVALVATGCTAPAGDLQPEAEAEIYATVIRQIYTEDDTFGGTLQPARLYIVGTTDDTIGDPEAEEGEPVVIPTTVREAVTARLADLPTEIIWVESQNEVELDPETGAVGGEGAIITLGNIAPEGGEIVHVPSGIYVANLAAGGQTYIVEQVGGAWEITGTTGPRWIS